MDYNYFYWNANTCKQLQFRFIFNVIKETLFAIKSLLIFGDFILLLWLPDTLPLFISN